MKKNTDYCMNLCTDPFPGEQVWICSLPEGHPGPHKEGSVAWSSVGSHVNDRHHDSSGEV